MGTDVKKLRKEVRELKQERTNHVTQTVTSMEFRSGILPPPEELVKYEEILPGVTERLLLTYEKQVDHRIELEKIVIKGNSRRANWGQILSFVIVIFALCLGGYLLLKGLSSQGIATIITAVGSLVASFIAASITRKSERERKNR